MTTRDPELAPVTGAFHGLLVGNPKQRLSVWDSAFDHFSTNLPTLQPGIARETSTPHIFDSSSPRRAVGRARDFRGLPPVPAFHMIEDRQATQSSEQSNPDSPHSASQGDPQNPLWQQLAQADPAFDRNCACWGSCATNCPSRYKPTRNLPDQRRQSWPQLLTPHEQSAS